MELAGKVIVVTGGFGQLGRALADHVIASGARCALLGRHAGDAPEGAKGFAVDLADPADAKRCMDAVDGHFGRIDGLANVAGGFRWQTLAASEDLGEWHSLFAMNLMTCVNACKAVLPHMQRAGWGRIVNVGAMGAVKGANGMGAYAASKAGVMRFTESLADELKLQGITVNAVLPGTIDTPQNRQDMPQADVSRWVRGEDLAKVMAFLLSDAAAAVTGALVPVTGRA